MYCEYYGIKCFKSWPRTYTCIAMVETSGTSGQQDILNIYQYQKANRCCCLYVSVIYLVLISAFVCFCSMPDRTSSTNFRFFDSKLLQRVTSQHTVNANELCTKALPGSCRFRTCIVQGVNRKGAEFISNKQTNSLTHKHRDTQLYISV